MKTLILDDDPTGTQSATDATVLLDISADAITDVLRIQDSVYLQTNSRALDEVSAVALMRRIREDSIEAGGRLNEPLRFVLRGDSTLRGHVFTETEVFAGTDDVIVFMPAFPEGGRVTRGGVHFVAVDGIETPAHLTEYAGDPVFPFHTAVLVDFVREKSKRHATSIGLDVVRSADGLLERTLLEVPPGEVLVVDGENRDDIEKVAAAINAVHERRRVIVRCASPLAASLAGVTSEGLLPGPLRHTPVPTLLVCGSHTRGAAEQLLSVTSAWGKAVEIETEVALSSPEAAGGQAAARGLTDLATRGLAIVTTERDRHPDHNTLLHGERVMAALVHAVKLLVPHVQVVVAKGGITSAETARQGIGATRAHVLGQILPGVSVWSLNSRAQQALQYVVVPGNVGGPTTITDVLTAASLTSPS